MSRLFACVAGFLLFAQMVQGMPLFAEDTAAALRWIEGQRGCTFSADDDGMYRYGLWTEEFGVVLAVDADELRKAVHRAEPTFAALLTFRYRGKNSLAVDPAQISLEFVKHEHDLHSAIPPADLSAALQKDADRLAAQAERTIKKHPERRQQERSLVAEEQTDIQAAITFAQNQGLLATELTSSHSEAGGWVFFSARGKWVGDWKKQEEFVLRIPMAGKMIEFPFALPPSQGDLILRRRGSS